MQLLPVSLSIGILAGIWTFVSISFGILTWPTFVGWAIFFFLGGNKDALVKAFPPVLVGIVLTYLTLAANTSLKGDTLVLSILVVVLAFILTFMMNVSWLAAAPAGFCMTAVYFGVGDPIKAAVPLIIGLLLGYISVWIPELFSKSSPSDAK
ncbi:MAG: DUF1097 domain-containing protein [Syntrophomonas sp.]|nr:DUF1097 domain-containing protein [Syntrophomonas sp.]